MASCPADFESLKLQLSAVAEDSPVAEASPAVEVLDVDGKVPEDDRPVVTEELAEEDPAQLLKTKKPQTKLLGQIFQKKKELEERMKTQPSQKSEDYEPEEAPKEEEEKTTNSPDKQSSNLSQAIGQGLAKAGLGQSKGSR